MSEHNVTDSKTLSWVKSEIDELLNQTRQALEVYVENPEDSSQLSFVENQLHQIIGTLQMVEVAGATMLAQEMEAVVQALIKNTVKNKEEAYDVLMQAVLQLPAYLERLQHGHHDVPVALLPMLNDLRATLGQALLSANTLFSPDLSVVPKPPQKVKKANGNVQKFARKMRTFYQYGLIEWYRDTGGKSSLIRLATVLKQLENTSLDASVRQLWWICIGVIEALYENGLDSSVSIKLLLGQIDRQIKKLMDDGEDGLKNKVPNDLLKNLLFYVGQAKSQGVRVKELRAAFRLAELLPDDQAIKTAQDELLGFNADVMKNVSIALKEDILNLKENLDQIVRNNDESPDNIPPFVEKLRAISDTLNMLGQATLAKMVNDKKLTLSKIVEQKGALDHATVMGVASTLLYVESSVEDSVLGKDTYLSAQEQQAGNQFIPESEIKSLVNVTVGETKAIIAQIKDEISAYAADASNVGLLNTALSQIHEIRGALLVLSYDRAGDLLHNCAQFISEKLVSAVTPPSKDTIDKLADVVSGIEYFLENVERDNISASASLDIVHKSLVDLGYSPKEFVEEESTLSEPIEHIEQVTEQPVTTEYQASQPENEANIVDDISDEDDEGPDEEVVEIFLEEADEELATIRENVDKWAKDFSDADTLATLRRSFHTLKGSGRIIGAMEIGDFAWSIEHMLNEVIEGAVVPSEAMIGLLNIAWDTLPQLIDKLRSDKLKNTGDVTADIGKIIACANEFTNGKDISLDDITALTGGDSVADNIVDSSSVPELNDADNFVLENDTTEIDQTIDLSSLDDSPIDLSNTDFAEIEEPIIEEQPTNSSQISDPVLLEIFSNETSGHLNKINEFIDNCEIQDEPCLISDDVVRAIHTLHGSAHMAGVSDIAELTDVLEQYSKTISDNQSTVCEDAITIFKACVQSIGDMLGTLNSPGAELANKNSLIQQVKNLLGQEHEVQKSRLGGSERDDASNETTGITIDDELLETFLREAREIIGNVHTILDQWTEKPSDHQIVDELRRNLHRLQGGAKVATLNYIADVCYSAETLLKKILADESTGPTEDIINALQSTHIWLSESFYVAEAKAPIEPPTALIKTLHQLALDEHSDDQNADITALQDFDNGEEELDTELRDIFVSEADSVVNEIDGYIAQWTEDNNNTDYAEKVRRQLHTLKGGARMAKLLPIADLCQETEYLLALFVNKKLDAELIELLTQAKSWIAQSIEALRTLQNIVPDEDIIQKIRAYKNEIDVQNESAASEDVAENIAENIDSSLVEQDSTSILDDIIGKASEEFVEQNFANDDLDLPLVTGGEDLEDIDSDEFGGDNELIEIFLEEGAEILGTTDDLLHKWVEKPNDKETIEKLQRALHTLKGGARMARIKPIGDLSHSIESILGSILNEIVQPSNNIIDLVQTSHDWLVVALDCVEKNIPIDSATSLINKIENAVGLKTKSTDVTDTQLTSNLDFPTSSVEKTGESALESILSAAATAEQPTTDLTKKTKPKGESLRVSAELLDNLVNYAGEASIYRSRVDQQLASMRYNLTELHQTVERLRGQLRRFEIETETQILFRHEKTKTEDEEEFDPLELDRYSQMQQLSRSVMESVGDLTSLQKLMDNLTRESEILLLQQSRVNTELQEGLKQTRLVPFSTVVPRLRRIVRQVGKELDKRVSLKVLGGEGELDRSMLNRMIPALEHMVRNAIDHGIELPQTRIDNKKPEVGQVILSLTREGSEIVLKVSDDGAGMNIDAIKEKAIEKGLMDNKSDFSDNETLQFILESGFSTAEKLTQISGRGVGMDVVNTEIKQLGGNLSIDSVTNKGSVFTARLPLTLSVNQALIVKTNEEVYAIPLVSIEGVIRLSQQELLSLYKGEKESYSYAGNNYKYYHLGWMLDIGPPVTPEQNEKIPVLLVRAGDHRIAMQVEEIVGRQVVVIKTVGRQIGSVKGISGATILGDGSVALVIDVSSLLRHVISQGRKYHYEEQIPTKAAEIEKVNTVMIVDDSITVRKVTERLLKRHDMGIMTAKDGVDALLQLQESIPDLMLLDIEMPRMDGYELATTMRNDSRLKHIPIIMITSRTGQKHRDRAMGIGVDMYMGKPFQESELMQNINTLLHESHEPAKQ